VIVSSFNVEGGVVMTATTLKRWAILIAVLSLIIGIGVWFQQFQVNRLARSVVAQADIAAEKGDFPKAEALYQQHLIVFPDDVDVQLKLADILATVSPAAKRQAAAQQIYADVLRRFPWRDDARRRQAELKFASNRLLSRGRELGAEADLDILLKSEENQKDGNLLFMMARCYEEGKDDKQAREKYQAAIKCDAPKKFEAHRKIEAYRSLATMLRDPNRLNKRKEADQVIEEMVKSAPENYQVYMERGNYRRQFDLPDSKVANIKERERIEKEIKSDYDKALKLADTKPEVYLELARIAVMEGQIGEAKKVLEDGLKKSPASAQLYMRLADFERATGHPEQAIETYERGLKSAGDKTETRFLLELRFLLALTLADRGDTGKLRLQIDELRNAGLAPVAVQLLTAYYHVNSSDFRKARQLLVPLEPMPGLSPDIKVKISNLLARCYSQLGEPELQREALLRALGANPQDLQAKMGLIDSMVKRGEIDNAIKEYRLLTPTRPQARLLLAQTLMMRNMRRPVSQRDWSEVKSAIDDAEKAFPAIAEPLIMRAESYAGQNQASAAREEIAKARSRFPKSVSVRCAQAGLMMNQKQFDEALTVLDEAQKELGDSIDLRLQRARLAVTRGGPQVVGDLDRLSENLQPFTKPERRRLLTLLAIEFEQLEERERARKAWSQMAEEEPNDLDLRVRLVELALRADNSGEIEKSIKQIEQIEGNEGSRGPYFHVRYLMWQAAQADEKDPQDSQRIRTKARALLNDLVTRRPDWSALPELFAGLEQQELRRGNLSEHDIYEKEESIIRSYRRAIDLGQRSSPVIRETVKLLFKHKRGSEALDLINRIPVASQLVHERQALSIALENRDFERALDFARKAVAANPADFQERFLLIRLLLDQGRQDEAEKEIRQAVELAKTDPDRWFVLVQVLLVCKQPVKAAQVIKEAEAALPPAQAPLAMAQCCAAMGKIYEGDEAERKGWFSLAKGWYEKAIATHPDDLTMVRSLIEFLAQTRQTAEVETQLEAILKNPKSPVIAAWARRTLALALAASSKPESVTRALTLLEPNGSGGGAKGLEDPDNLRALARVLEAQKTAEHRKRAIDVARLLVDKNLATTDDRFFLARLEEFNGNWPKALEVYRDLYKRTQNPPQDVEAQKRRAVFLLQFAHSLLSHHKAGNEQNLNDVQDLVDELIRRQPDALDTLALRVDVYRVRNQLDKAAELIVATSHRPDLLPTASKILAGLAENLDRIDIAEPLYRKYAAQPNTQDGTAVLAQFLSRHGRVKDGLDLYEPLWAQAREPEPLAAASAQLITSSKPPADKAQVARVAAWLEQALDRKKDSTLLVASLANFREHQGLYEDAKALYQRIIKQVPALEAASSNTKTIVAMSYNNRAWLMSFKEGEGKGALADINQAIKILGPMPDFLDTRGVIQLGLKQTDGAISDLETAVKSNPSPSKFFHLAQAYFQKNNKEKAKQFLREAKARGLDRFGSGTGGLHTLEEPAYQKLLTELGLAMTGQPNQALVSNPDFAPGIIAPGSRP
jgi:cellulose synthase operon protein C